MMDDHWLLRLIDRLRPPYGWIPFWLLAGAIACVGLSVLDAAWVDGDIILLPVMALGFLSAVFLAGRKARPGAAWVFLVIAGLLLSFVLVAELWPPAAVLRNGDAALVDFWRARVALFIDRAAGWYVAVRGGGRSTETLVFALGLAVAGWFVAALVGWSAYGARKPFVGLSLAGLALAVNTFYGQVAPHWAVFFFGLAITAGTYLTHIYREQDWEQRGVDYPDEVRTDIILYSAGISLALMSLAMAIPAINLRAIAEAFQRQESVAAAEQLAERAFAGIAPPRTDEGTTGGGGLPRSFLIGGGPELFETVAMTATWRSETPVDLSAYHWRSTSFDIYTGRGWQRSPERETNFSAGALIPYPDQPTGATPVTVTQDIDWVYDRRATRYTLGRPIRFSHHIVSNWRGLDEFVGARGANNAPHRYTVETLITPTVPDGLRAARLEDIPPQVRARYTALPDSLPDRVVDLAHEITTAPAGSPPLSVYDQARAIETFLHQYPYTLDLPPPPRDVDIVDYFLFDLQTGFCDYYASAMVVLARAVGLPARLGVGFIQKPADPDGVQTIYQADAHSWAEVYFAGYGWVEFEPTAAFAAPDSPAAQPPQSAAAPPTFTPGGSGAAALPIPQREPQRETPWLLWLGLIAAALVAARLWGRELAARFPGRNGALDDVQMAYARLQAGAAALGDMPDPARTPAEFAADLLSLPALASPNEALLRPEIERLAELFAARQYGRLAGDAPSNEARRIWQSVRRPLRRIAWRQRLRRID